MNAMIVVVFLSIPLPSNILYMDLISALSTPFLKKILYTLHLNASNLCQKKSG